MDNVSMAAPKETADSSPPAPKNWKPILMMVGVALNLVLLGGGAFLVYSSTLGHVPKSVTEEKLKKEAPEIILSPVTDPFIYTLEKITANLAGSPPMMIEIEVNLEVLDSVGYAEVMNADNRTRIRAQILKILTETTFDEVESLQGKLFLKQKIINQVNALLNEGIIKNVYFSDFKVQNQ